MKSGIQWSIELRPKIHIFLLIGGNLNPEDFQYNGDYFARDEWAYDAYLDDWFVRRYSTVDEMEDRATIIEAIFDHDRSWWNERPHLKAKRDRLLGSVKPIFGPSRPLGRAKLP